MSADSPRGAEALAEFSTRAELAEFLKLAPQTLARWTVEGRGPRPTHLGRAVRYRRRDIEAYLNDQR